MKKLSSIKKMVPNVRYICWDLDGTLFDTEVMWYNMEKIVKEKYGDLKEDEVAKKSEEIASNAYKTWDYRNHADDALKFFKANDYKQIVINKCDLTNITMLKNETIKKSFPFSQFDLIVSEKVLDKGFTDVDMYLKVFDTLDILDRSSVVAICDMPFELKAAKDSGVITIWAKNKDYPFTEEELKEINENADYYVEDFRDLI